MFYGLEELFNHSQPTLSEMVSFFDGVEDYLNEEGKKCYSKVKDVAENGVGNNTDYVLNNLYRLHKYMDSDEGKDLHARAHEKLEGRMFEQHAIVEKFLIGIAEEKITVDDIKNNLRNSPAYNPENKIRFYRNEIENNVDNSEIDCTSDIKRAFKLLGRSDKAKPEFATLCSVACLSCNNNTAESGLEHFEKLYANDAPEMLLSVYKNIIEDEKRSRIHDEAIQALVKHALQHPEIENDAKIILAKRVLEQTEGTNTAPIIGLISLNIGKQIKWFDEYKDNLPSAEELQDDKYTVKIENLKRTLNTILINSNDFSRENCLVAFKCGMELATKVPSYRDEFVKDATAYVYELKNPVGKFWNGWNEAKKLDDFIQRMNMPVATSFNLNKEIMLKPMVYLSEGHSYKRMKEIANIHHESKDEIKHVLCNHLIKDGSSKDNRYMAYTELQENHGFSLGAEADKEYLRNVANDIERTEYVEQLFKQVDIEMANSSLRLPTPDMLRYQVFLDGIEDALKQKENAKTAAEKQQKQDKLNNNLKLLLG